ncbi:DNA polymerase III subunit alpha [Rubrobacter taiwanensis]|jgi:DNA polymerase-3 subunit alpha|uniref:DNA polymerase III subunit alpha n=1 Tax=Rubrobacter taiwanensis TaxID=185139 RepID=A0A4R1BR24_9ACTN|nr:DNA polymerase III subunit alpha [Rubrobacter taiwanensis]TCJ20203.1 DNA polymerase III subunit alpha [Rubrobacter taiwanensis]
MPATPFAHLHCHSEYSMLDGATRIKDLVGFAREQNMPGIALTDHGAMYGAVRFYQEAQKAGVKPLMGCEVYVTEWGRPASVKDRTPYYHLTLLARTAEGYRNLMKLSTAGYLDGFYYKPRVDRELLRRHGKGIICLSGCLSAEVPRRILEGRLDRARELLLEYQEIFDAVFLEMQDHGIPEQKRVNEGLIKLHKDLGLELVAANDSHYTSREDAKMHDVLLCIGTGKFHNDPNRMRFHSDSFYIKTADEMERVFPDHERFGILENTLKVVEMVEDPGIELGKTRLPNFPKPPGYTAEQYLRELCERGLARRYGKITPEIRQRLEFELETINKMGFADYFLIVWDFVKYAKDNRIAVGPGRGSAAGSIVAYALEITDLDPLQYSLLFERFLNPDRISMPDVDIDFSVAGRSEVMKYVTEKYGGHEHVAQIITFGTIGARAAIRDAGRVFQYPYNDTDRLAKLVPEKPVGTTLRDVLARDEETGAFVPAGDDHLGAAKEMISFVSRDEEAKKVLETAFEIEGYARHVGTHAAGVVISEEPLTDIVPLQRVARDENAVMVQHPMSDVEALGLLKVDFLGLRNLDVIEETLEIIRKTRGEEVNIREIPLDDKKTLELFARGDTFGVFQFESEGMQRMLQEVRPDRFDDLVALNALYRPGPMEHIPNFKRGKQDPESVEYLDPRLKPILEPTYGVAAYQEQLMEISKALGNFTPGEADTLRKAIGKKKKDLMATLKDKFIQGCRESDVREEVAEELWAWMEAAGGYSFNKSHSACYSFLAFQTAYLKAHYPREYMAALMSSVMNTKDRVPQYVAEARSMGIEVLPPDVNESGKRFTVVGETIRFGLAAVKNVGEGCVEAVIEARKEGGPFEDIFDFCERVDPKTYNKRVLESLIKCGAFDSTGHSRAAMLAVHAEAVDRVSKSRKVASEDQFSMFEEAEIAAPRPGIPPVEDDPRQRLEWEKETLGLYVTGHPLRPVMAKLRKHAEVSISDLEAADGRAVRVAGLATGVRTGATRKGDMMATLQLDDTRGLAEVLVFPRVYKRCAGAIREDAVLKVQGRVERREGVPRIIAMEVEELNLTPGPDPVYLALEDFVGLPRSRAQEAISIIKKYPGESPLILSSRDGLDLRERLAFRVNDCSDLHAELKQLLGARCISNLGWEAKESAPEAPVEQVS